MTDEVTNEPTHRPTDAAGDGLPTGNDLRAESPFYYEGAPQAFQRLWTARLVIEDLIGLAHLTPLTL